MQRIVVIPIHGVEYVALARSTKYGVCLKRVKSAVKPKYIVLENEGIFLEKKPDILAAFLRDEVVWC